MNNSYLIQLSPGVTVVDDGETPKSKHNFGDDNTIGLFHGNYQLFKKIPSCLEQICNRQLVSGDQQKQELSLTPFAMYSSSDELAEFRILNHKDRVIIRSIENNRSVLFGINQTGQYFAFDINGVLVVRGPVSIEQLSCAGGVANDDAKTDHQIGKLTAESVANETRPNENCVKYSGHLTLNISGFAWLDLSRWWQGIQILLPSSSRFAVERQIPHWFQQKSIVQRQKDKFQSTEGMMALETFDHWLR